VTQENGARLRIEEVSLRFGGLNALSKVSLEVRDGELLAIIGPNGAGKSCLLNCINGFYRPQEGDVFLMGNESLSCQPIKLLKWALLELFRTLNFILGLAR